VLTPRSGYHSMVEASPVKTFLRKKARFNSFAFFPVAVKRTVITHVIKKPESQKLSSQLQIFKSNDPNDYP